MDYSLYYREELKISQDWESWDLFLSAYNHSDRLRTVYDKVVSEEKYWLIFPEYGFGDSELPGEKYIELCEGNEYDQFRPLLKDLTLESYKDKKICVDATGFMRPQLLFLLAYFKKNGFYEVDFIYSEPDHYVNKENTSFSNGSVRETRQVIGYQGANKIGVQKDLLIIAAGYDTNLISKVAQYNENAEIIPLLGFPSLRADMFQENILRTIGAEESLAISSLRDPLFAPASDPFETASAIERYIDDNDCLARYGHVYLCPLSTKPQVLGIGLAYLNSFEEESVSVLYPFAESYSKSTSSGFSKMWKYKFEF